MITGEKHRLASLLINSVRPKFCPGPNKTKPELNLAYYPVTSPNPILAQPNPITLAQPKHTKKKLKKLATKVCHHPHLHLLHLHCLHPIIPSPAKQIESRNTQSKKGETSRRQRNHVIDYKVERENNKNRGFIFSKGGNRLYF